MTDSSMNFGPAWIRNLHSEGSTTSSGGGATTRYQLAEHRYGREEMLAIFDKSVKPPASLITFKKLYSEQPQVPLALLSTAEEEQRGWQPRPTSISGAPRGRGGSLERGGRISRGRGGHQSYGGRTASAYDSGWGNGEQPDWKDWSPRKEYSTRSNLADNWRRVRDDDDGWRNISLNRPQHEKWGRSSSWRADGETEERNGPPGQRATWHENNRTMIMRRSWDNEDHLPEWATENPTEGGGTFDERGAFHGSDDELERKDTKKDFLQKSTSQQNIINRGSIPGLSSSKSTSSLIKSEDTDRIKERHSQISQSDTDGLVREEPPHVTHPKPLNLPQNPGIISEEKRDDVKEKLIEKVPSNGTIPEQAPVRDRVDEDFDRIQEDLVFKLVVDEETPKPTPIQSFDVPSVPPPPPNLVPTSQEKWYYQDPQGTRQGPFANVEMAEWFKAGYFSNQLNVMRECDEKYFLLGELITVCGGENPFLSNIRYPTMKNEAKLPDGMLNYQFLSKLAFQQQQQQMRNIPEPWSALSLQQPELAAQRLLLQQQQVLPHEIQYLQQQPQAPLMYMINQMQQNNKLPGSVLVDKPSHIDPLLLQLGNLHNLQNRMQPPLHNHVAPDPLNLQSSSIPQIPDLLGAMPNILPAQVNRPPTHSAIDPSPQPPQETGDSVAKFLKQFHDHFTQPVKPHLDLQWQKPNNPFSTSVNNKWTQEENPLSMWELQGSVSNLPNESQPVPIETSVQEKEKEPTREEITQKELKKRKELEEKQSKKEAEERRKQEQRKQEAEKKLAEEKKKKEEEKIRKELERAKRDAEEKRLRELEEKRRLKEQRKAEEEARKKSEEQKKAEDEKIRREAREREERKLAESIRLHQSNKVSSKVAPWSQPNNLTQGLNLTEIQKAEKEKKAQETALQIQKQEQQQMHQLEKQSGIQLNWAKKPIEHKKVKSLNEIQAEEHEEKVVKLSAEARLYAQLKEKEPSVMPGQIWNGQSLTWANASSTSQWSSSNSGGFWDEVSSKSSSKPSTVSKSSSSSAITTKPQQQSVKQSVTKTKKDEQPQKTVNNNNNIQSKDEFAEWCYRTLSNLSTDIDIPTFVGFLRDLESAYEVRDYCKEYLGENSATLQFASNFLEKRRLFKPKNNAHIDDMCSPAPAITPSAQHSTEFQEVKGKNKKNKKSKMLKVDNRILGFNVTAAPDRINVGDRDYGDNS